MKKQIRIWRWRLGLWLLQDRIKASEYELCKAYKLDSYSAKESAMQGVAMLCYKKGFKHCYKIITEYKKPNEEA